MYYRDIRFGMRGEDVRELQKELADMADDDDFTEAHMTGFFGEGTRAALLRMQVRAGLVATGTATSTIGFGPRTRTFFKEHCDNRSEKGFLHGFLNKLDDMRPWMSATSSSVSKEMMEKMREENKDAMERMRESQKNMMEKEREDRKDMREHVKETMKKIPIVGGLGSGRIISVTGDTPTVEGHGDAPTTVSITGAEIRVSNASTTGFMAGTAADLHAGDLIMVKGMLGVDGSVTAHFIQRMPVPHASEKSSHSDDACLGGPLLGCNR